MGDMGGGERLMIGTTYVPDVLLLEQFQVPEECQTLSDEKPATQKEKRQ